MKKKILFIFFAASVSLFFAAKKSVPDWLTSPSSVYPSEKYLNGVGTGTDRESAELEAVNNLASIFGQKITSKTDSSKKMTQAVSSGEVSFSTESSLNQQITKEIQGESLIGVEIPQYYFNESESKWYAIAILEKEKTSELYKNMIAKNESTLKHSLSEANSEKNSFYAYSEIAFCMEIARKNDKLLTNLGVINPQKAKEISKTITNAESLRPIQSRIANEITISIKIDGDKNGKIASFLQDIFSAYGFNTTNSGKTRYYIKGTLSLDTSNKGKTFYCVYSLDSALIDSYENKTLFPINANGREGAPNEKNSLNRAYKAIEKKMTNDFGKKFEQYISNTAN